ncbi:hypothetical protein ANAEL_05984 [Anaerolineales bacterium]|nr:hypothetical protein ANAEL_05984 [Anaerolineales bacterium]
MRCESGVLVVAMIWFCNSILKEFICSYAGLSSRVAGFGFVHIFYSYASVSLTVRLDALLAGRALASEPSTMVKTSHAKTPLTP